MRSIDQRAVVRLDHSHSGHTRPPIGYREGRRLRAGLEPSGEPLIILRRTEASPVSILWIIIIVILVLAVLGYFGRGRMRR